MKLTLAPKKILIMLATATIALTSTVPVKPSSAAATFDEQEVDQELIVAIARPYGKNRYDLLVIEQVPGKQQCWSEAGSNPTLVEPLLLKFDFTGHCRRGTDSNGYSLRIQGQDLGLNYLLRIVEQNGELFLVGTSRTNPGQRDIIIGRSYGIKQGFVKLHLNAGWKFSKRSYQGKVLGHVYFSGDRTALNSPSNSTTPVASTPPAAETRDPAPSTPPATETRDPAASTPPATENSDRVNPSNNQSNNPSKEITITAGNSTPSSRPSSQNPQSPSSSQTLPTPPSIPTGQSQTPVATNTTASNQLPPVPAPPQANDSQVVPRPTGNTRSNSQGTVSDMMSVNAKPLPGSNNTDVATNPDAPVASNYRVLVEAPSNSQQQQLRSLYPDAFRTVYQGRGMWQVGVFNSWDNADQAVQRLRGAGLEGLILD